MTLRNKLRRLRFKNSLAREIIVELSDENGDVTASEIATFTFCATAWHLEHVRGVEPAPEARARRAAGIRQHAEHGRMVGMHEQLERRRVALIVVLILIAVMAVATLLLAS